jgi:hypothetical protein
MSVVKLNQVDGLPEFTKVRKVVTERQKARVTKRASRFVMIEWGELITIVTKLGLVRHARLLFVLLLHRKSRVTQTNNGWIELKRADLVDVGLADSNLSKATYQLETLGLVEVQRRPGKRPLLRLIKP